MDLKTQQTTTKTKYWKCWRGGRRETIDICGQTTTNKKQPKQNVENIEQCHLGGRGRRGTRNNDLESSFNFQYTNIDQKLSKKEMLRRAPAFKKRNLQYEGTNPREKHFFHFISNGNVFVEVVSK